MNRRDFLGFIGGAAGWPVVARGQQPAMPVVGFLHIGSPGAFAHLAAAVRQGLAEHDLVEGRNVAVEYRWAEGHSDRLPALAADLVQRRVAVIVAISAGSSAARKIAPTMPIVFVTAQDPVELGFVESLNRPGGNMTGYSMFTAGLEAKRLGLLRDVVPAAKTIAVLIDGNFRPAEAQLRDVQEGAARLGVQLVVVRAHSQGDFDTAFSTFVQQGATALQVCASPFFNGRRDRLLALASRHKLPAVYEWREFAEAGGLASYGASIVDAYRQAGAYAGRVLKGAKPADLPVLRPSKFELIINLKTAKALGVAVPQALLLQADEVIR